METNKNKLFLNCDEAKIICDKSQYNESTFWERLRLGIRYAYCHITRSYVKRNKKLSNLVSDENVRCMNTDSKNELKTEFEKKLQHKQ
jgi:hypothetical protein